MIHIVQKLVQQVKDTVRAHFGQSNFPFFQQKRKKEILLILIIFTYFKVRTKIEKKKMVRKIDHFFIFLFFDFLGKTEKSKNDLGLGDYFIFLTFLTISRK